MAVSFGRRIPVLAGVVAAAIALMLPASPAHAQVPPGTQATPLVGGPTANCPPGSPGAVVSGGGTVNGVTVTGGGRCTPLSAAADGSYSLAGFGPLPFSADCANVGGTVQTGGGVQVPAGTIVNGTAVATTTTVTTLNTPVTFPGGRTAILNQVITTPTTVTRNAIVFTGGPVVGQVVCGATLYPLAVETAAGASPAPALPAASSGGGAGVSTGVLLLGGAFALAVAAQLTIGRRVRRRKGDAAG